MAYINSLSNSAEPSQNSLKVFNAISDLEEVASRNKHTDIVSLAIVLQLRELLQCGMWTRLFDVLKLTEDRLDISSALDLPSSSDPSMSNSPASVKNISFGLGSTNLQTVLMVYTLIIGVLFHTYAGDGANAQNRMKRLHEILDGGALNAFGESGIVKVDFPDLPSSSLEVQVTHPSGLFSLCFLISSVAKRDPVGRRPKRKLFAHEGLLSLERELRKEPSCMLSNFSRDNPVNDFQSSCMGVRSGCSRIPTTDAQN